MNGAVIAGLCAGLCVFFLFWVLVDFFTVLVRRYKEKYLAETAVEMDDVLLSMPPAKIFDISLILAVIGGFALVTVVGIYSEEMSWKRIVVLAVLGACAAFPLPRIYLRKLKKQRLAKFNEQLEDALLSMSSSLKAGFSINQALEVVAREGRKPISFEFTLLLQEMRLGVSFDDALNKMSKRVQCQDFELVAVSIMTARQTGGELTSILERLAGVIRERVRITGRIRALTAQGRMQAAIIGIMPFALLFAMMKIAPDMTGKFFSSLTGILCLIGVVLLDLCGFLVIRKITTIDI